MQVVYSDRSSEPVTGFVHQRIFPALLLHVPLMFATRRKNSFFFPEKNPEIIFLRKIGLRLLSVPRNHTHRLLSHNSVATGSGCDQHLHDPKRAQMGAEGRDIRAIGTGAQEEEVKSCRPGTGTNQAVWPHPVLRRDCKSQAQFRTGDGNCCRQGI